MAKNNDDWVDVPLNAAASGQDDWQDLPVDPVEKDRTFLEDVKSKYNTAGAGIAQGLTFGLADEALGAGTSAVQSLLETLGITKDNKKGFSEQYAENRDFARNVFKQAEQDNPGTYMAADIAGSVAPALVTGGAGLLAGGAKAGLGAAGKVAAKEAIEKGVKEGSLKALMAIGAAEGGLHGLGRSESETVAGNASDALQGAAFGAVAPVVIKGALAAPGAIDDALSAGDRMVGGVGYNHLKAIGKEGMENLGQSFKQAGIKARDALGMTANKINEERLAQDLRFEDDLIRAQKLAGQELKNKVDDLKYQVKNSLGAKGAEIERANIAVGQALDDLPMERRIHPGGEAMSIGKFHFSPDKQKFADAISVADKKGVEKMLTEMQDSLGMASYPEVVEHVRSLSKLIEKTDDDYTKKILGNLRESIKSQIDENLAKLPVDQQALHGHKQSLDTDYSLLKDLEEVDQLSFGASKKAPDADLGTKASIMNEPGNLYGLDATEALRPAYQLGEKPLTEAADAIKAAGAQHNKLTVNPTKGELFGLPEGQVGPLTREGLNEANSVQSHNLFGAPKKGGGLDPSFANTIEELNVPHESLSQNSKQEGIIQYLKNTYGDKADDIIAQLREESKKFQTLKGGLGQKSEFATTTNGIVRFLKSIAEPVSFEAGKGAKQISNAFGKTGIPGVAKSLNKAGVLNQVNSIRAATSLTRPESYKKTVEDFKQSQEGAGQFEAE